MADAEPQLLRSPEDGDPRDAGKHPVIGSRMHNIALDGIEVGPGPFKEIPFPILEERFERIGLPGLLQRDILHQPHP